MKFVLSRDKTFMSTLGLSVEFKKGEPVFVPPPLWAGVQAIGAIPENELPEELKPESKEPEDPMARKKLIFEAFEQLKIMDTREDFTAAGLPHAKAVAVITGFSIDAKERDALWQEFVLGEEA